MNEIELSEFVNIYNLGLTEFFLRGKTYSFDNIEEVLVFDNTLKDYNGKELEYADWLVSNIEKIKMWKASVEDEFKRIGKDVTTQFIKNSYGALSQKAETQNSLIESKLRAMQKPLSKSNNQEKIFISHSAKDEISFLVGVPNHPPQ